jgi:hypothetical protein
MLKSQVFVGKAILLAKRLTNFYATSDTENLAEIALRLHRVDQL